MAGLTASPQRTLPLASDPSTMWRSRMPPGLWRFLLLDSCQSDRGESAYGSGTEQVWV